MRRAMRRPIPMSFSRTPLEMQKSARHRGRQKVAGQAGQVIWQIADSTDSTGMVTVRRKALAVILPIVDIGLAHRGVETSRRPGKRLRRTTLPTHRAGIARFLLPQLS